MKLYSFLFLTSLMSTHGLVQAKAIECAHGNQSIVLELDSASDRFGHVFADVTVANQSTRKAYMVMIKGGQINSIVAEKESLERRSLSYLPEADGVLLVEKVFLERWGYANHEYFIADSGEVYLKWPSSYGEQFQKLENCQTL